MNLPPETFIARNLPLTPLAFRPDIRLHRPDPQSGLNAWLATQDRSGTPPYWAYAWGGGAALALYLRDHPEPVKGRTVLDFGAGSGLVGIAAARAGASAVFAIEPDPIGQVALMLNAAANGVEITLRPGPGLPGVDLVLAGDVFYDADIAARTLPILEGAAASGKTVLVGDPFRRNLPLDRLRQIAEYAVPDMGGTAQVKAGVFILDAV